MGRTALIRRAAQRGCTSTSQTRILAITACASEDDQERMHAACDDLLLKPCNPEVIATRIRTLLEMSA